MTRILRCIAGLLCLPAALCAQADSASRSWNQPVEPFRIAGNVYYVGASDITSFLITDSRGHIVIDAGFVETVPQIIGNIRKLGFDPADVRILLNTQAHWDHAAGFADLKRITRARLFASAADAVQLENGGRDDFAWGDTYAFTPVKVDSIIMHGDTVRLGDTRLVANATPGHTRGCTTWTTRVTHNNRPLNLLFHCSSSFPGYKLVNNEKYPQIADDYRRSFEILAALPCDVPLSAHGSFFGLTEKTKRLRAGQADAFVDPAGCKTMLANARRSFETELKRQRSPVPTDAATTHRHTLEGGVLGFSLGAMAGGILAALTHDEVPGGQSRGASVTVSALTWGIPSALIGAAIGSGSR